MEHTRDNQNLSTSVFNAEKLAAAISEARQAIGHKSIQRAVGSAISSAPRHGAAFREAREIRLREATAEIIRHNRRIRDTIIVVMPFYLGDPNAKEPPLDERLEKLLNPKCNGAHKYLTEFGNAAKAYLPGEYPQGVLQLLNLSTHHLIEKCLEPIRRRKEYNISSTVVDDLYNYLTAASPGISAAEHAKNIDEHIRRMQKRFCMNSDAGYALTTEIMNLREEARKAKAQRQAKCGSKRTGLRGTRTKTMIKQFKEFQKFLESNPVTEHDQGRTVSARAAQFWNQNAKTFERSAAHPLGSEKRGYPNAKALASAYRASR